LSQISSIPVTAPDVATSAQTQQQPLSPIFQTKIPMIYDDSTQGDLKVFNGQTATLNGSPIKLILGTRSRQSASSDLALEKVFAHATPESLHILNNDVIFSHEKDSNGEYIIRAMRASIEETDTNNIQSKETPKSISFSIFGPKKHTVIPAEIVSPYSAIMAQQHKPHAVHPREGMETERDHVITLNPDTTKFKDHEIVKEAGKTYDRALSPAEIKKLTNDFHDILMGDESVSVLAAALKESIRSAKGMLCTIRDITGTYTIPTFGGRESFASRETNIRNLGTDVHLYKTHRAPGTFFIPKIDLSIDESLLHEHPKNVTTFNNFDLYFSRISTLLNAISTESLLLEDESYTVDLPELIHQLPVDMSNNTTKLSVNTIGQTFIIEPHQERIIRDAMQSGVLSGKTAVDIIKRGLEAGFYDPISATFHHQLCIDLLNYEHTDAQTVLDIVADKPKSHLQRSYMSLNTMQLVQGEKVTLWYTANLCYTRKDGYSIPSSKGPNEQIMTFYKTKKENTLNNNNYDKVRRFLIEDRERWMGFHTALIKACEQQQVPITKDLIMSAYIEGSFTFAALAMGSSGITLNTHSIFSSSSLRSIFFAREPLPHPFLSLKTLCSPCSVIGKKLLGKGRQEIGLGALLTGKTYTLEGQLGNQTIRLAIDPDHAKFMSPMITSTDRTIPEDSRPALNYEELEKDRIEAHRSQRAFSAKAKKGSNIGIMIRTTLT